MVQGDIFQNFSELNRAKREGIDFRRRVVDRGSRVVVVAPHGGGIEPGTSEIAFAAVGELFSVYCFEGLKDGCEDLHLTSHRFDDTACINLLNHAQVVVAVHGCAGKKDAIYVGGRHDALKSGLIHRFEQAGFTVRPDPGRNPGLHQNNLCNRAASGAGIQLELTEGLRQQMFSGLTRPARELTTPIFHQFVHAFHLILCQMERTLCEKYL